MIFFLVLMCIEDTYHKRHETKKALNSRTLIVSWDHHMKLKYSFKRLFVNYVTLKSKFSDPVCQAF